MDKPLEGILCPLVMPCDDQDTFLEDNFRRLIESVYQQGVHGVYVCGASGDAKNLRPQERRTAAQIAVEMSKPLDKITVIHVGATTVRDSIELAEHAATIGADAISSFPPGQSGFEQIHDFYTMLARASQLPLLIYHFPALTHITCTHDEILRLIDIDGVVGMKMTDWNLFILRRLMMARPQAVVFNGYDEMILPGLLLGARGGIGTWYNAAPKAFVSIYKAVANNDVARALAIQEPLHRLMDLGWQYGVGEVIESLLRQQGFGKHYFRRPRSKIDPATLASMEPELIKRLQAINEVV